MNKAIGLVGHIHDRIDVFAAPFITYGVYTVSYAAKDCHFFKQDAHDERLLRGIR